MPEQPELKAEIGHVLFLDIVGYSKLLINEQSELLEHLKVMVQGSEQVRAARDAGQLIRLATGDGMALVFRNNPEAPAHCALELARADQQHPELQLRMGIHSGPINEVTDVNDRANVTGAGINLAQRVMDCGDAGHILLSKRAADDLAQYRHWQPRLHDLGEVEVKHGVRLGIVSLQGDGFGNAALPEKLKKSRAAGYRFPWPGILILLVSLGAVFYGFFLFSRNSPPLTSPVVPPPTTIAPATPAAALIPEKSIAVLPFENLSEEKANAYFADGVQDEILTNLARIADLKVISRTSVMQYRTGAVRNLREIGQQLGVAHLLEGSVQRAAGKVRVNAQLIDARTDAHLWAHTYDRDLADVFAIQSEIARTIAEQLQAKISPRERAAIAEVPTYDLMANALYVEAKQLHSITSATTATEPLHQAIRLLEEAVSRDPKFVAANCLLGRIHLNLYFGGIDHTDARREMANAAIQTAARLRPESGEVHLGLAAYAYHGFRDYDRARAELELARATLPNDSNIYSLLGAIDRRQGRWTESIRNYDRAVTLDPRDVNLLQNAAFTYRGLRRYAESDRLVARVIAIVPRNSFARLELASTPFAERADTRPLRKELSAILQEKPEAAKEIAYSLFNCALWERDAAAARRALEVFPAEGVSTNFNFTFPKEWFVGLAARTFNEPEAAGTAFTAARAIAEKLVHEQPDYAPAWSLLGMIDAALGRREEAVREGQRACELLPLSKDAWIGSAYVAQLALIHAWNGEKALALEKLPEALQGPSSGITYGVLKLDPRWDALRGDPRFEEIVASLGPTEMK